MGSRPSFLRRASSFFILSGDQLPLTASSGWLGYIMPSPRSISSMLTPFLAAYSVTSSQSFWSVRLKSRAYLSRSSSVLGSPTSGCSPHMLCPSCIIMPHIILSAGAEAIFLPPSLGDVAAMAPAVNAANSANSIPDFIFIFLSVWFQSVNLLCQIRTLHARGKLVRSAARCLRILL